MAEKDLILLEDDSAVVGPLINKCLVGSINCRKKLNSSGVANIVHLVWKIRGKVQVSNWKENGFIFTFDREEDADNFFPEGPWTIMGWTMVLCKWDVSIPIRKLCFYFCSFWIQIHCLPVSKRGKKNIRAIASLAGTVVEVEEMEPNQQALARFVRARVSIDIREPLRRGFKLKNSVDSEDLDYSWFSFKFEWLGNFWCGSIYHERETCSSPPLEDNEIPPYGLDLRADNFTRAFIPFPVTKVGSSNDRIWRRNSLVISPVVFQKGDYPKVGSSAEYGTRQLVSVSEAFKEGLDKGVGLRKNTTPSVPK